MKPIMVMVLLMVTGGLWGQKQVDHQQQIWYKYYLRMPIGDHWQIRQEFDDRNFVQPSRQSQFLTRTHLQRNFGKGWDVAIGFACFIHTLPQEPEVQDVSNQTELRPSVELANLNTLSPHFQLHHRFWTELRYFNQTGNGFVFNNFRLRYKLELRYLLSDHWSFLAFDEILINAGRKITYNTFDQNRYGVACMYSPVKNIGLELMYLNWFQQQPSGDSYYDRDILRIALHQTLPLGRKKEQG